MHLCLASRVALSRPEGHGDHSRRGRISLRPSLAKTLPTDDSPARGSCAGLSKPAVVLNRHPRGGLREGFPAVPTVAPGRPELRPARVFSRDNCLAERLVTAELVKICHLLRPGRATRTRFDRPWYG